MSTINEFQFELLPDLAATDGQVFGIGSEISVNEDGFHPGSTDWANQDSQSGVTGVTLFGSDKLLGPVWAWDLHVDGSEVDDAVEKLGRFTTAWRALQIRKTPGLVIPLRYHLAGRDRRIFGRPGKIEPGINNLILSGYADIICDFQAVDGYTYDDQMSQINLGVGDAEEGAGGGGFVFPVVFPNTPTAPVETTRSPFAVGGDAPTHPVIRLTGPWVSPGVATDDWTVSFPNVTLGPGQYIEIDTRPWANTILLNGVTSFGGALGRRQRLVDVLLHPGSQAIRVVGSSESGTGAATIRWANAYNSL